MNDWKERTIKLRDNLSVVAIDDEGLLLDITKKCYYSLNDTAAFLLKHLEAEDLTFADLQQRLVAEYEVESAVAQADIDAFLSELRRWDLLRVDTAAKVSPQQKSTPATARKSYQPPSLKLESEILTVIGQQSGPTVPTPTVPGVPAH